MSPRQLLSCVAVPQLSVLSPILFSPDHAVILHKEYFPSFKPARNEIPSPFFWWITGGYTIDSLLPVPDYCQDA